MTGVRFLFRLRYEHLQPQSDYDRGTVLNPIAVADARTALDEVQLKSAYLVGRCRIGRAFEPCGEPLATLDVAALSVWVELARSHIFDHMLTQRTDGVSLAHGELLPE